jgi:glycosyltransferase involved in cell wall biosynthesis
LTNSYVPKFSYIIPFRFRTDRIIPLRRVIDWLNGFQGIEIIIVEQDTHSKISHLNLRARHIFTQSEYSFNKSWAYNVGIRWSSSPIVIFGEADTIMNPHDLGRCLETFEGENLDVVFPIKNIIRLDHMESLVDLNVMLSINRQEVPNSMSGGISIFKKESIQKIGGWNEDFVGITIENQYQDMMVSKFLKWKHMDFSGFHLSHIPEKTDPVILQRSEKIMEGFKSATEDQIRSHISTVVPKVGLLNKYQ